MTRLSSFGCLIILVAGLIGQGALAASFIVLQSTTSTQNSGLLDAILPEFTEKTGIEVRVVAVGTGQALRNGRNGDGDVLLVHSPKAEQEFVELGFGLARHRVMYNDFVVVGPVSDPAGLSTSENASAAFSALSQGNARFVSRGDNSGTHMAELRLWATTKFDPHEASGTWYLEAGAGMGATLNVAVGMNAYALTDRATWIAFENKANHRIVFQGDSRLFNQYGVIAVNPDMHDTIKAEDARVFVDWLLGQEGQKAIDGFRSGGQQLFFANAD